MRQTGSDTAYRRRAGLQESEIDWSGLAGNAGGPMAEKIKADRSPPLILCFHSLKAVFAC